MKISTVSSLVSLIFSALLLMALTTQLLAAEDAMPTVTACETHECRADAQESEQPEKEEVGAHQTFYYRLYMLLKLFNKQGA